MKVALFVSLLCAGLAFIAYAIGDRFVSVAHSSSPDVATTTGQTRAHTTFHSEGAATPSLDRTAGFPAADRAASQRVIPPAGGRLKNTDKSDAKILGRAQTSLIAEAPSEQQARSPIMERGRGGDPMDVRHQALQLSERQISSFALPGGRTARDDNGGAETASKARAPGAEKTRASADSKGELSKSTPVEDGDPGADPRKAMKPSNESGVAPANATAVQPPSFANEDYMTYEHHLYRAQVGRRAYAQEASELGLEQARLKASQNP